MTSDLVSGTVVTRTREPEGLQRMMMVSVVAHAAALAALATASSGLGRHHAVQVSPMQISLPGAAGPVWTDMVREPAQAPRPPVKKPLEMAENVIKIAPKPVVPQPGASTTPAPPAIGPESLLAMNGQNASIDFCDPEYLGQMVALLHRHWQQHQNVAGKPIVRFVILRDGTLTEIALRQPSGYAALDLAAMRAVTLTGAIPPLPACYPHPRYAMNLTFEYIR